MPLLTLPDTIPVARYRFTFRLSSALQLPPYAGSTLRGVFGHALRRQICTCGRENDHPPHCPYSHIFTRPHHAGLDNSQQNTPPQPYLFEPPADGRTHYPAGASYRFNMVLTGQARLLLPLIVSALQYAFEQGVGTQKGRGMLDRLEVEHNGLWLDIGSGGRIRLHPDSLLLPEAYPADLTLHLYTPLRLQQHGKILRSDGLSNGLLLRQAMRRISALAELYWPQPLQADYPALAQWADSVQGRHELYWHDWQRYSNRQHRPMKLGGVTGRWHLYGVLPEFAALLYIGQWLHLGKETVFGLGGYRIQAA